ncbi:DegV family protein [Psychrobacillus sp. BL-248-WT-3]|uniref:DegV family protein n=1 Tax=Psychrobacillus sp. BL-248-WT-3 TaxID=2725306 RepID=UPI00146E6546|nr:DegV family protein [Psychrobacillus sp. BL-248-WT-3]NME07324.1 DegV family protein [Psychrobacillus sp. BL-248-WT-3]
MRIFADSASDLPKLFFETNQVELAPLRVHIDDKEYEDINDIVSTEVYAEIRNGKQPKTSQTSPEHFLRIFEDLAKSGEEGIYIAFSSELSGTYSTAVMMKEQLLETYPDMKLTIIDSKCASLGYGLLVKEAVKLRNEGLSLSEIEEKIRWNATHMEHLFTVDDLDYMARGGRVSKASAFIGGLLNIKPVLHVEEGKLVPIEKIRGTKKVMKRIVELVEERGGNLEGQVIAISHADVLDRAQELKEMILEKMQPTDVEIHLIGSTIGAHTGPGAISVFFLNKEA